AAMGFVSYHGMPAEKFVWVWLRSEMIEPKEIRFLPTNLYYEAVKDVVAAKEKEEYNKHDEKH
ncbi:MAG: PrgI family protein, partial [Oscillospiraceae bacterium]|nr:PrgI family protein [Oscillospiraceae bacterium]